MISIVNSNYQSPHLVLLQQWFTAEWGEGDGDFFQTDRFGQSIPAPLIALEAEQLVGGLSFTCYPHPETGVITLWVNALLVGAEFRGKNIAHQLIQHAAQTAGNLSINHIFARTELPQLYEKSGWHSLKLEGDNHIMKKQINKPL